MRPLRLIICMTTVALGCIAPEGKSEVQTPSGDFEAASAGIERTRRAFAAALKDGRYEDLGSLVTPDALTVGPGSADWELMRSLGEDRGTAFPYDSIIMRPEETVLVSDSVAWDFGTSTVYFTNNDGEVQELRDTFLAILNKDAEGQWRLHREVASSWVAEERGGG